MRQLLPVLTIVTAALAAQADETAEEPKMAERFERIDQVFNGLNKDTMHILDDFYAEDVSFKDPLGSIEGRDEIRAYYENLYESVQEIRFEFSDHVAQDDTCVVVWTMYVTASGLNGGDEVVLEGNSVIRFNADDKVVYHRDYFDMGEFIYENVPVLGFFIRRIKDRLAHD